MRGEPLDVIMTVSATTVGVLFMAMGFEGWMYKVGQIGWGMRTFVIVVSAAFLYPEPISYAAGIVLALIAYGIGITRGGGAPPDPQVAH